MRREKIDLTKLIRRVNFTLLLIVLALASYGALIIYSATSLGNDNNYFRMQIIWILLGIPILIGIALLNYKQLKSSIPFIYGINLILLTVVILVGESLRGAQRWIDLGFFRFQPSEFCKVVVILSLASFLAWRKDQEKKELGFKDVLLAVVYVTPPFLLIFFQPDLGTGLVLAMILLGMLLAGGVKGRYLIALVILGVILGLLVINFGFLKEYQIRRLLVFINPDLDPLGAGYTLNQSKIAIGSGGFFGKGLFSGTQTSLQFIPAAHTDFIFSVLGEKLGFLGAFLLVFLYFLLISRGIQIAALSSDFFGLMIASGIISMWLFQILVNIGMTIGIMPITGIPLPFMSYGGSAMLSNMASVGLLLSIYARRLR